MSKSLNMNFVNCALLVVVLVLVLMCVKPIDTFFGGKRKRHKERVVNKKAICKKITNIEKNVLYDKIDEYERGPKGKLQDHKNLHKIGYKEDERCPDHAGQCWKDWEPKNGRPRSITEAGGRERWDWGNAAEMRFKYLQIQFDKEKALVDNVTTEQLKKKFVNLTDAQAIEYLDVYPDLQRAFKGFNNGISKAPWSNNIIQQAKKHWREWGRNEGRWRAFDSWKKKEKERILKKVTHIWKTKCYNFLSGLKNHRKNEKNPNTSDIFIPDCTNGNEVPTGVWHGWNYVHPKRAGNMGDEKIMNNFSSNGWWNTWKPGIDYERNINKLCHGGGHFKRGDAAVAEKDCNKEGEKCYGFTTYRDNDFYFLYLTKDGIANETQTGWDCHRKTYTNGPQCGFDESFMKEGIPKYGGYTDSYEEDGPLSVGGKQSCFSSSAFTSGCNIWGEKKGDGALYNKYRCPGPRHSRNSLSCPVGSPSYCARSIAEQEKKFAPSTCRKDTKMDSENWAAVEKHVKTWGHVESA